MTLSLDAELELNGLVLAAVLGGARSKAAIVRAVRSTSGYSAATIERKIEGLAANGLIWRRRVSDGGPVTFWPRNSCAAPR